jgi:hypothetical protein
VFGFKGKTVMTSMNVLGTVNSSNNVFTNL